MSAPTQDGPAFQPGQTVRAKNAGQSVGGRRFNERDEAVVKDVASGVIRVVLRGSHGAIWCYYHDWELIE